MRRRTKLWRPAPKRPYKPRDPRVTSAMMAAVRNRENKAEVALRKELWRRGFRYRLYHKSLPGRPDIVFAPRRTVVFVDGDFWHGRALIENGEAALLATLRTKRRRWWLAKLKGNVRRDREVMRQLRRLGWRAVRVWESDATKNLRKVADRVERFLQHRATGPRGRRS